MIGCNKSEHIGTSSIRITTNTADQHKHKTTNERIKSTDK